MVNVTSESVPLDFSFKNLTDIEELKKQRPRRGLKRYRRSSSGRYHCTTLRLNNNCLVSAHGIHAVVYQLLEQPERLTWLDISFNRLTTLPAEISAFSNLKIAYLHGNLLSDLSSVLRPLKCLNELYSLTLHGNPLEEKKGYRAKILANLVQLKSLDFTNVTSADRKRALSRKEHPSTTILKRSSF